MSKRSYITTPIIQHYGRISVPENVNKLINHNELYPTFSFEYVQKDYCISKWDVKRIRLLIEKLGEFEKHKWQDITNNQILHFKKVSRSGITVKIPNFITPDTNIYYIKPFGTNSPYRVFGIRDGHHFKFIWFDCKHEIYP